MERKSILIALAIGLVCLGIGAGLQMWWAHEEVSDTGTSPSTVHSPASPPVGVMAELHPSQSAGEAPLIVEEILALDSAGQVRAIAGQLPVLTGEQLHELAGHLTPREGRVKEILSFLVFTRWGELDYEAAASFCDAHPREVRRVLVETGRAAVDLSSAARQPMDWERRQGLQELMEQLPADLALRVAKRCFHPEDELIGKIEITVDQEKGVPGEEPDENRENPEDWARRLAAAGRKGDWSSRYSWDRQAVSLAEAWGRKDPEAAVAWIMEFTTDEVQREALRAVELETVYGRIDPVNDPANALAAISNVMEKFRDLSSFRRELPNSYSRIVNDWLKRDRPAALDWLHHHGSEKIFDSVPILANLDEAARELEALPAGPLRTELSNLLSERWVEERREESLAWLRTSSLFPQPEQAEVVSGVSDEIDPFADAGDEGEPDLFYEKRLHNKRMEHVFHTALEHDLPTAMQVAARSDQADWILNVVRRRDLADPGETIEWLGTIEADWDVVSKGWDGAMHSWIREAPTAVAAWVDTQPDSPVRDIGISAIIGDLLEDGPGKNHQAAVKWALAASDRPGADSDMNKSEERESTIKMEYLEWVFQSWAWDVYTTEEANEAREVLRSVEMHMDEHAVSKARQALKQREFRP